MSEEQPSPVALEGDVLSCVGRDWTSLPAEAGARFGPKTRRLDLSYNSLKSLAGIEAFTSLRELVVDNNELGDGLAFPAQKELDTLTLNNNRITNVDQLLETLVKSCPKLTYLSLLGNLACPNELVAKDEEDYQRYRYYVLYKLPNLKFLDSRTVTAAERAEAKRVGAFMRVVRPSDEEIAASQQSKQVVEQDSDNNGGDYQPLPDDLAQEGQSRSTFGVCKYVYYGRHSEGNRFIRNNDL
ncbi:leucine-rich repeat-containing protein C10 [Capsaspora owczarzaki ATCC 30864]|uniref:Leucine-rich repeat-containing protein C10 n=1 Tax=Capsaspora owczarzaki (strain ATCC 30864) TaxID=595528 RepID=A0A0D2U247_CAPO3|nr:leucine-rich repeat-containing protein C10 [Capsaspora owczarzaki ATCC 30864]KJE89301.1 leucine-rich repeat-containing protein C10 [Capsaspora owczarzaki ATCC 30864]|eukprot:XP_004365672.1 leucine-rich repeat-containing protein C10 [Capsaspora owczarzaki ATCC 30864]